MQSGPGLDANIEHAPRTIGSAFRNSTAWLWCEDSQLLVSSVSFVGGAQPVVSSEGAVRTVQHHTELVNMDQAEVGAGGIHGSSGCMWCKHQPFEYFTSASLCCALPSLYLASPR